MKEVKIKTCPFLDIRCNTICPAWFDELDDCMFHLCMTQVEETFYQAAAYMAKKCGIPDDTAIETLWKLQTRLKGKGTEQDKRAAVREGFVGIFSAGVLDKLTNLTLGDVAGMLSSVDKVIKFDLFDLFASDEEEEEDDTGLVFAEDDESEEKGTDDE